MSGAKREAWWPLTFGGDENNMTNPAGMPSNEDIVASVHDLELEGDEQSQVTQQVTDFIAAKKAEFDTAMANLQAQVDNLSATAMDTGVRSSIKDSLTAVKAAFDGSQRVLLAAITPPSDPLPEPTPETPPSDTGPLGGGGSRGSSRRR